MALSAQVSEQLVSTLFLLPFGSFATRAVGRAFKEGVLTFLLPFGSFLRGLFVTATHLMFLAFLSTPFWEFPVSSRHSSGGYTLTTPPGW